MGTGWSFWMLTWWPCFWENGFQFPEYFCSRNLTWSCRGKAFCLHVQLLFRRVKVDATKYAQV